MRSRLLAAALLAGPVLFAPPAAAQQGACFIRGGGGMAEATERPSPLGTLEIAIGGETATLCYGRPSARGRTVMGELVPLDRRWRLGANEATALHLPFAVDLGGVELDPGSYSLYAVPGESEWEFFVNGSVERWGIPINDAVMAQNIGSFTVPAGETDGMVEQMTFTWETHGEGMGHLVLEWENTRVEIPLHAAGM